MREKGVHARFRPRWIENQLVLPVFMMHQVVVVNGCVAKGLVVGRQAIAKYAIVRGIRDCQHNQRRQQPSQNDSLEPWAGLIAERVAFDRSHGLNYTCAIRPEERSVDNSSQKNSAGFIRVDGKPATRRSAHTSKG